jgi:Ca2+-binding EF-hand superfamily protein
VVRIQKLTQFIDLFNFYPVKVNKLRSKNDSNELTYVMSSGTHGTKNEAGEIVNNFSKEESKTEDEKHLLKLLSLVSNKISERFLNLQRCFRYLDVDHSQSISINEFAQAIEHMRLKLSFEDIKKLFNFIDKKGNGEIGYEEFTCLLEERWRGIDPASLKKQNRPNPMLPRNRPELTVFEECPTQHEVF